MSSVPGTEYRNLLVAARARAARITLNRPGKRDALSLVHNADGGGFSSRRAQTGDELLLTGERIAASTALDWGLVNRVVPLEELELAVAELVESIARPSPYTVATGKQAFYVQVDRREHDACERCQIVMEDNALAIDAQEGMSAFLEKCAPNWRGMSAATRAPKGAERTRRGWSCWSEASVVAWPDQRAQHATWRWA